jgi:PadR family transcriptional regulator PadR
VAPRITYQAACVLQALSQGYRFGFDIMDFTGLPSGTVYPILRRFEKHELVESEWEDADQAADSRRPRRRNYRLTAEGRTALALAADRLALHRNIFAQPDAAEGS